MLKLITAENSRLIKEIHVDNILKTRILCYALCYGFDKEFIDLWASDNCIIMRFDDSFTVYADKDTDYSEVREFLDIMGAKNIITSDYAAYELGFYDFTIKTAFEYIGNSSISSDVKAIDESNIEQAYLLISNAIPDSFRADRSSYLSFLSDFTYRKNRGFARGLCIENEGTVVATALTASETPHSAIMSGISCAENCRSLGYGKIIVHSLAEILRKEDKSVFVIALNDSAIDFYKHIGFSESEKIAYISR